MKTVIKYLKKCTICGNEFFSGRAHAKTDAARCRLILHKMKKDLHDYSLFTGIQLEEMEQQLFRKKAKYVEECKMMDLKGNKIELINAFVDSKGDIQRIIFRNKTLNYLETWNHINEEVIAKLYTYG